MKRLLLVSLTLAGIATAQAITPAERAQKMQAVPITVYPDFDVQGTSFVPLFNRLARPTDAMVVSYTDALKSPFRVANLGLTTGGVWLYVNRDVNLTAAHERNLKDVRGVVFVPDRANVAMRRTASALRQDTTALHVPLIVGLDDQEPLRADDVRDVALSGDIITIYPRRELQAGGRTYRDYVERVIAAARAANPRIRVEVAVAVGRDEPATAGLLALLADNIDLADRVGIFCNRSPESDASLAALFRGLRAN